MAVWVQVGVFCCLLLAVSTACVSRDRVEAVDSLPATSAAVLPSPQVIQSPTFTPTRLPSPAPQPTPIPLTIETPTPVTPVSTATPLPTEMPTIPAAAADPQSTVVAAAAPRTLARYPSPDRVLEALVRIYDCTLINPDEAYAYEELVIRQRGGASEQKADSQLRFCGGLGAYGLAGLVWAPNGRYFYYTTAREGVPDGCGTWGTPVIRHDIITGTNDDVGYGAVSPNAVSLATWQDGRLLIWNLSTTTPLYEIEPALPDLVEGPVVWSPSSDTLAYLLSDSWCPGGQTALVLVDVSTGRQRIVADELAGGFSSLSWPTLWRIIMVDDAGQQWVYAVDTDSIAQSQ